MCDGLALPGRESVSNCRLLFYRNAFRYYLYMIDCELAVVNIVVYFLRERQKHLEIAERLRRGGDDLGAKKALALLPSF